MVTMVAQAGSAWNSTTSPKTIGLTWQAGDLVVILAGSENGFTTFANPPTTTGLTFTNRVAQQSGGGGESTAYIWTAVAASNGSGTISLARSSGVGEHWGLWGQVWRNTDGVGATAGTISTTSKTLNLARAHDNSAVVGVFVDWNALSDVTVTATPTGTVDTAGTSSSRYTWYVLHWDDQGAAGTTAYGVASHTGTPQFAVALLEIQDSAATPVSLVPLDSRHGHTVDTVALDQSHQLGPQDATHPHVSDEVALTQNHVLSPGDSVHGHVADEVTISQVHQLVVEDSTHPHTSDDVSLGGTATLAVNDSTHGHTADEVALTQNHVLVPGSSRHAHTSDQAPLTQNHVLTVGDTTHRHVSDEVALSVTHVLAVQSSAHRHTADEVTISVGGVLLVQSSTLAHVSDEVALTQQHQLVAASSTHPHTADEVVLSFGASRRVVRIVRPEGASGRVVRPSRPPARQPTSDVSSATTTRTVRP